jgi:hypothetical protein
VPVTNRGACGELAKRSNRQTHDHMMRLYSSPVTPPALIFHIYLEGDELMPTTPFALRQLCALRVELMPAPVKAEPNGVGGYRVCARIDGMWVDMTIRARPVAAQWDI